MDVNMTIWWVASVWHSVTFPWKILAMPLMADTKTQENNNYNCGLTLHRQPNRLFPKNHFHFSCIVFLSFFLFSTRHPAFKSQEHRFPTVYFKPVSWITFYLLLSILTKNLSFLCGCHGKARLLLVIIRKYTSVALFMRIHEHV